MHGELEEDFPGSDSQDGDVEEEEGSYIEEACAEANRLRSIATALSSLFDVAESSLSIQETLVRRMRTIMSFPSHRRDNADNAFNPKLRPNIFAARKTLKTLLSSLDRSSTRLDAILTSGESFFDARLRLIESRMHMQRDGVEHGYAALVDGLEEIQRECNRLVAAHEAAATAGGAEGGPGENHTKDTRDKNGDSISHQNIGVANDSPEDTHKGGQAIAPEEKGIQNDDSESRRKLDAVIMEVQSEMLELLLTSATSAERNARKRTNTTIHQHTSDESVLSPGGNDQAIITGGEREEEQYGIVSIPSCANSPSASVSSEIPRNEDGACARNPTDADRVAALDVLERKIEEKAVLQAITLRNERSLIGNRYFNSLSGLIIRQRNELNRVLRESERRERYLEARIASLHDELERKRAVSEDESESTERALGVRLKAFEDQIFRINQSAVVE